ncbi:hypothetical protein R3P38DRAFT_1416703 [Favolaschia claudopus]|uniref:Uncharacterized protein n=1 Tax=Favolaschia claudopus TaxID=2862362 RepID=A0AAW0ANI7_9AGAR
MLARQDAYIQRCASRLIQSPLPLESNLKHHQDVQMATVGIPSFPFRRIFTVLRVKHNYTACGHIWELPQEEIKCESTQCIFSDYHPRNCGPRCRDTCWQ